MAKTTSIILILLGLLATFLIGMKVGMGLPKNIAPSPSPSPILTPTSSPSPTITLLPTDLPEATGTSKGTSTYTDKTCGFSFSYSGSYLKSKSANGQATILTDPSDNTATIAATCLDAVPRPPVSSENIESITLSGQAATLYHDTNREIIIVKNPKTGKEILLAGVNPLFSAILKTFKLI